MRLGIVLVLPLSEISATSKRLFRWFLFWRRLSPPALFLASFALLIVIGWLGLLGLPGLHRGPPLGPLDALFTMTSAVCVTGLVVVDTATRFTIWGQLWILLFIQLGGLGLITLTTMIIGALGRRLSLRSEMLAMQPTHRAERADVWQVALGAAKFALIAEGIGAAVLFLLWVWRFPVLDALWHAIFHSVSAFCNAGFSTFSDSLMGFQDSPLTLLAISALIVMGGIGYLAHSELVRWWKAGHVRGSRRLSSHTWAAVVTSVILLIAGWILFALFEWGDTFGSMGIVDRIANALFMSVTPRTAGFNSIDYATIGNDSAALTMMLMVVGGSPGSMAGGIKTTTLAVLIALGMSRLRGRRFVELQWRAVPEGTIERAVGIALLAAAVLTASFFLLSAIQAWGLSAMESQQHFLPVLFETISAFSTVGLSMGETTRLHAPGLVVVIVLMFIGRVGLLAFFAAVMLRRGRAVAYTRPAQEDVIVG